MNNPPAALLGDDYLNLPGQILPTTFDIDVTGAVKQWVWGSKPNNGFIFRGVDETFPETNNECTSVYTDFALKVTYQPK